MFSAYHLPKGIKVSQDEAMEVSRTVFLKLFGRDREALWFDEMINSSFRIGEILRSMVINWEERDYKNRGKTTNVQEQQEGNAEKAKVTKNREDKVKNVIIAKERLFSSFER